MVQSPSWEANWFAASQEIPRISRNPKVHYRTHKRSPPVYPGPAQSPSIYPHPTSLRSILILSTHLRLGLPSGLLLSGFPSKTQYTPHSSPIRATCPAHLILLDFITRTLLDEEYKSFSSSLCNLLYSPVTSSLLGPNILLNTMFSNNLSFLSFLNVATKFHTHTKPQLKLNIHMQNEVSVNFFIPITVLSMYLYCFQGEHYFIFLMNCKPFSTVCVRFISSL